MSSKVCIAVHGGAGVLDQNEMDEELKKLYGEGLSLAVQKGHQILLNGGSAIDAVASAVTALEDNPLFNAGRGSVFTFEGKQEMDASLMDGSNFKAGSVAMVRNVRNPIQLARKVMDESPYVLLAGTGAEEFAKSKDLPFEPDSYFFNEKRYKQWQAVKDSGFHRLDDRAPKNLGTVGAVALDQKGNLAAGTSTGGMTNKRYGRIGDSPLIGAGTYADNQHCAVSCTGHGEFFIRVVAAYDVVAGMSYGNLTLKESTDLVVMKKLLEMGGEGGLIAIDRSGNIALPFNAEGMYRGWIDLDGVMHVAIYSNELTMNNEQ